jgi:hypothetical protein
MTKPFLLLLSLFALAPFCPAQKGWDGCYPPLRIPRLENPPRIDGDLTEWKYRAFSDGVWDILRVRTAPWYDPRVNRLTDHGNEPDPEYDLNARYYMGWDDKYLYFGAEAHDNVNDVDDPAHTPERWYYKDAICWFIEAPRRGQSKKFGQGDNAFCFVIDARRPPYGAWWRHGSPEKAYIEEPIPKQNVDYVIRMDPWRTGKGDFILEARVEMAPTLGKSDPGWQSPKIGDEYGLEIVHTDPDGGDYGGHLLIYGKGDDDATWIGARLTGPIQPPERKKN